MEGPGTVFTFAIGGKAQPPEFTKYQMAGLLEGVKYDPAHVGPGTLLYITNCAFCHGVPGVDKGGNIKNLGYSTPETISNLKSILFAGPFLSKGMPDFTGKLNEDDVTKIAAFIQGTADSIRPKK
jgi:quinohemoprotein ethanol dehydrogenase